jgi:hypothetical protein
MPTVQVNPFGLETQVRFEYAISPTGPWTLAESLTCPGERQLNCQVLAILHHLTPETTYHARVVAESAAGEAEATTEFTTTTVAPPEIPVYECAGGGERRAVCGESHTTSIDLTPDVESNGAETEYRFESSTTSGGPWSPIPGAAGTVTIAEDFAQPHLKLEGLAPETTYYVRGAAQNGHQPPAELETSFQTASIKPRASTEPFANVGAASATGEGRVYPGTYETHWRFEYATGPGGPWTSGPGGTISSVEAGEKELQVEADLAGLGPSTTYYVRLFAENEPEPGLIYTSTSAPASFETAGGPAATTFATTALHGEVPRALGSVRPHGFDTHYHFQYVSQAQFTESLWTDAADGPELDAGGGGGEESSGVYPTKVVGQDLPGLKAGETYDYRIIATSLSPGESVAEGEPRTLTVPSPASVGPSEACPNQELRFGPSANLPDCRAYEQVTPVDKEGSLEPFHYESGTSEGAVVGEDGDHLMLANTGVTWGHTTHDGSSPYFFSRTQGDWQMSSGSPQPQTGIRAPFAEIFSPDLTQFGFESGYFTSPGNGESREIEFGAGPPGGPYTTLAVPRKQAGRGWVAASEDFSKLILQVEDRELVQPRTTTQSGSDLYEYSDGQLRQVNLGVGTCGARIVSGHEEAGIASSRHAVSADGSRVFFEAVPGSNCSAAPHLYVRVAGTETIDLGARTFIAANSPGTMVLVQAQNGEFTLIDTETTAETALFTAPNVDSNSIRVSEDFTAIYFDSLQSLTSEAPPIGAGTTVSQGADVYRYDIPSRTLSFLFKAPLEGAVHSSPDGRYAYFESPNSFAPGLGIQGVAGVPGGGLVMENGRLLESTQVYRYDSAEHLIQCVSCSSPFNPEPTQDAAIGGDGTLGHEGIRSGLPDVTIASANGDFVFFETPAALVPRDIDGEVTPTTDALLSGVPSSLSSDVYEWRRSGIDGCTDIQGCLALITNGRGGYLTILLGSAEEGRDVFFYTSSQLGPRDNDTAGDIYDARIGGGEPPIPARPVECEGDACHHPFTPPAEPTLSTSVSSGPGNGPQKTLKKPKPRHRHPKHRKARHHKRAAGPHRRTGK